MCWEHHEKRDLLERERADEEARRVELETEEQVAERAPVEEAQPLVAA